MSKAHPPELKKSSRSWMPEVALKSGRHGYRGGGSPPSKGGGQRVTRLGTKGAVYTEVPLRNQKLTALKSAFDGLERWFSGSS